MLGFAAVDSVDAEASSPQKLSACVDFCKVKMFVHETFIQSLTHSSLLLFYPGLPASSTRGLCLVFPEALRSEIHPPIFHPYVGHRVWSEISSLNSCFSHFSGSHTLLSHQFRRNHFYAIWLQFTVA